MIALKKILVATDFSEPSDAALAYGRELARGLGGQLVVLHVVPSTLTCTVGADGCVVVDPGVQTSVNAAGQDRVDQLISGEDRTLLRAQGVVVPSTGPAFAIAEYARTSDVNLIVMGTHGRCGMAHLLLGSVAERVVRIAPCPVLTVRYPEREFIVPDSFATVEPVPAFPAAPAQRGLPSVDMRCRWESTSNTSAGANSNANAT